eukprot:c4921_g1_i1.p1 GENE.c4921_g1_i1~~c4921_g1_i1.p1  ORF type:complete len:123 (-),score=22.42 c4921_g1_i1:40-408(-)
MPYASFIVNCGRQPTDAEVETFIKEATTDIAAIYNKPLNVMAVHVDFTKFIGIGGTTDPFANVKLDIIADVHSDVSATTSAVVANLVQKHFGIPSDRVFLQISQFEKHLWGWKGSNIEKLGN